MDVKPDRSGLPIPSAWTERARLSLRRVVHDLRHAENLDLYVLLVVALVSLVVTFTGKSILQVMVAAAVAALASDSIRRRHESLRNTTAIEAIKTSLAALSDPEHIATVQDNIRASAPAPTPVSRGDYLTGGPK